MASGGRSGGITRLVFEAAGLLRFSRNDGEGIGRGGVTCLLLALLEGGGVREGSVGPSRCSG